MSNFVIKRIEDGKYVALPGQLHSYVSALQNARTFNTVEQAERECCGNEHVVAIRDEMFGGDR